MVNAAWGGAGPPGWGFAAEAWAVWALMLLATTVQATVSATVSPIEQ